MVAVDPLASLRITTTFVTLAGHLFEVEKHGADDWLEVIISGRLYQVLPGWIEDDAEAVLLGEMLMDGTILDEDLDKATKDVISVVGGRPSWWIFNMVGYAASNWGVMNGHLIKSGIRAEEISLAAWIDAAYALARELQPSQDEWMKVETHLEAAPAGTELDEEDEGQAFLDLMASI